MANSLPEKEQSRPEEGELMKAERRKRKRIVHDTESESEISSPEKKRSPAEEGKLVKAKKRKRKRIVHDTESESEISEVIPEYVSSDDDSDYTEYDGPSSPESPQIGFRQWYDSSPEDPSLLDANDGDVPYGASMEYREDFDILFSIYNRQLTESEGFDIDEFPGPMEDAITPRWGLDLKVEYELMMELAKWAIDEYNKKECNEFKYEVLKIVKVNDLLGADCEYYMAVKVLNTTLVTPIESFQIGITAYVCDSSDRRMLLCWPKEEEALAAIKANGGCFAK